jgi:hypothetical protein
MPFEEVATRLSDDYGCVAATDWTSVPCRALVSVRAEQGLSARAGDGGPAARMAVEQCTTRPWVVTVSTETTDAQDHSIQSLCR